MAGLLLWGRLLTSWSLPNTWQRLLPIEMLAVMTWSLATKGYLQSKGTSCIHRPIGSIRKVVRLVTGPKEIAARGSGRVL